MVRALGSRRRVQRGRRGRVRQSGAAVRDLRAALAAVGDTELRAGQVGVESGTRGSSPGDGDGVLN